VTKGLDAAGLQAFQIKLLGVCGRGFQEDLVLIVMLETMGVFTVSAIGRTAAGFHVGHSPGFGTQRPEEGVWRKGSCSDFQIIGLDDEATLTGPVIVEALY